MELYERIKKCADLMQISDTAMAHALGLKQSTWAGYLKTERQHKLWPLLPAILKAFPRISRQWLYFEEGPVFIGLGTPADQPVPPICLIEAAEQMARDCGGSWGTLLGHIAGMARQELASADVNENCVNELIELQRENRQLHQELHRAKDRIIALLERQTAAPEGTAPEGTVSAASMPGIVHGIRRETDL